LTFSIHYEYIHLFSYNVHGLNNTQAVHKLSEYVHNISPKIDGMLLQEHKLKVDRANNLGQILWMEASNWTIEVSHGILLMIQTQELKK